MTMKLILGFLLVLMVLPVFCLILGGKLAYILVKMLSNSRKLACSP